jgi:hypothetical protein
MEGLQLVDIEDTDKMHVEIQRVTEQRFDLSMSMTITMSSLREKLGFLSDTEFATNLLSGDIEISDDVDNVTAIVLTEIFCLFSTLRSDHQEINLGQILLEEVQGEDIILNRKDPRGALYLGPIL